LANAAAGLSAAEIRAVCDRAALNALRRAFPSIGTERIDVSSLTIRQTDFDEAVVEQLRTATAGQPMIEGSRGAI
jgi:SpoVK/Ycf46/Vps4 family AAA+-type ATPase